MTKTLLTFFIGFLISAVTLYFSFRNIPADQLAATLKQTHYIWIFPSALLVVFAFVVRAVRWQILLQAVTKVSFSQAYHPLQIGFMLNCTIPARIGELARPVILAANTPVSLSGAFGSVVLERFLDLLVMILCLVFTINFIGIDSELNLEFGTYILNREILISISRRMLLLSGGILILIFLLCIEKIRSLFIKGLGIMPGKAGVHLIRFFENFSSILISVRNPKVLSASILSTLAVWFLHVLSYYVLTYAFSGIHLTLIESFFYMTMICFFITLPSVPGYWGLWEAGGVFALLLLGHPESAQTTMFTLLNHVVQLFPVIILGLISLWVTGLHLKDIKKMKRRSRNES